jgi:hypothetical protein
MLSLNCKNVQHVKIYLPCNFKIEQFWPFEEISIFSNGGHLGYRTALTDSILKGDHPRIISAKFG